jgi:hypothetical protein
LRKKVNWILDADIRDFFSRLDRAWLEKFLEHRIAGKRILRLIRKWLSAGVIEDGKWSDTQSGCRTQMQSHTPIAHTVFARSHNSENAASDPFVVTRAHCSHAAR